MNDEKISAFLDREGDEQARAQTSKSLQDNAGGAMRLRIFKKADDLLRRAAPPVTTPGDHALAQRILNAEPIRRPVPLRFVRALAPLAAACLLGFLVGDMSSDTSTGFSLRHLSSNLRAALETAPSGETRSTPDGEVMVAMTMRTPSGELCRQFRLADTRETTDAIACREAQSWRVIVAASPPPADDAGYRVAAGGRTPLDAALRAMGEVVLVDEAEERALLDNGWSAAER